MRDETATVQAMIDAGRVMGSVVLEDRAYHLAGTLELRGHITVIGGTLILSAPIGIHLGADVDGTTVWTVIAYRPSCQHVIVADKGAGLRKGNSFWNVIRDGPADPGRCFLCGRDPHAPECREVTVRRHLG